jgi:hypothetical protein
MARNVSVYGILSTRLAVEEAVDALRDSGYRNTDISVLFPDNRGTKDFAVEKHTKMPEGTAAGAASGAAIGGTLGWLAGIGALAIPGIGPFIAAGPIVAALSGAGAGAISGGLIGALVGLGMPEFEAKRYEGRIRKGGILLSVHCDDEDWARKAKDILRRAGAEDVASSGEAKADFAAGDKPQPRTRTDVVERHETLVRHTDDEGRTHVEPVHSDEQVLPEERPRTRTAGNLPPDEY